MISLNQITHVTFDCYGTLIDWERGILAAMQSLLARHGVQVAPEVILQSYVRHEARLEAQPWMPYREILRGVMTNMAADFKITLKLDDQDALVNSLPNWPPFPDTVAALKQLATRFKLVILSNTDQTLFAETQKQLQVPFTAIITAEQVRSYKPGHAHFHEALRRLDVAATNILHVAQSLYHDHAPARALGFPTAWINRPSLLPGTGLAPKTNGQPDLVAPDLATLVTQLIP
jgi:2-haloacid dehalogenase